MIISLLLISILETGSNVQAGISATSANLTEKLKSYDKRVRPFADRGRVNVSMQLGVIGLGPVDATSLTIRMDFYFRNWWQDERLDFGDKEFYFNGDASELIWVPDIFIRNSVETKQHKTLTPNSRTKIGPNGMIYSSTRLTSISFCKMYLANYPFDRQTCEVNFESYSYSGEELFLEWKRGKPPVEYLPNHVQLSGYELMTITGKRSDQHYNTGEVFPVLLTEVRLRRTFTYHLYSGYMPSILLVLLTWATFWIPAKAVPARVTLIVTNFLSTIFVMQQEIGKIVRVDYTTAVQVLLVTNLFFVLLAMVEYLVVLNIEDTTKRKKLTIIANGLAEGMQQGEANARRHGNSEENEKKAKRFSAQKAHVVDYYSRIGVPIIYFIFLSAYTVYYVSNSS